MKRCFVVLMSLSFALTGCVREKLVSADPANGNMADVTTFDENNVVSGWIRIRLSDDAQPLRVGAFTRGEFDSGNQNIDDVAALLGATEIRAVFPTDPRFEARHRRYGLHLWFDLKIDESVTVTRACKELNEIPGVDLVEPIYKITYDNSAPVLRSSDPAFSRIPDPATGNKREMPFDDPYLPLQWNYDNDGAVKNSVAGSDIALFEAWDKFTHGTPEVIVAIMDEGVYHDHEDLRANMWVNEAELNGTPGVDDDGNGYVDDVFGYDFVNNSGKIHFGDHGTHVAGTIAAVNNNGIGVGGIAGGSGNGDGVRIMTCPFTDGQTMNDIIGPRTYVYAADNGAVISQNSWGFSGIASLPKAIAVAFDYFINEAGFTEEYDEEGNVISREQTGPVAGGTLLFAAGNSSADVASFIPANDPRVITVGAVSCDNTRAPYSNYGAAIDICAPGGCGSARESVHGEEGFILSTITNNEYAYFSGTSMACPHVSGVAALIASYYGGPGFTNNDLKAILLNAYKPINYSSGSERYMGTLGNGTIDASLIAIQDPKAAPGNVQNLNVYSDPYGREGVLVVEFDGVPADADGRNVPYLLLDYAVEGSSDWKSSRISNPLIPGSTFSGEISNLATSTTYTIRVKAQDRFGNISDDYVTATATTADHVNLPPKIKEPFSRINLPEKDDNGNLIFTVSIDLNNHFTDPDIDTYGDYLTFSATSNNESILTVSVEGSILTITALKSGDVMVVVKVSDMAGNSIERNLSVRISQDPPSAGPGDDDPQQPQNPSDPSEPSASDSALSVSPNPADNFITLNIPGHEGESVTLNIYDSASRSVLSKTQVAGQQCDISALAPGFYSVRVTLPSGEHLSDTFIKK